MGRIERYNGCKTLACCDTENLETIIRYPLVTGIAGSYNYYMKFFNQKNETIPCGQFTSNTGDYCVQFADYAASSDPVTCNVLDRIYQGGSADDMSFDLF
mgnify:CR=1 FL=1